MKQNSVTPTRLSQAGVGMFEVIITVLVVMLGIVGAITLQTKSIRLTHSAYIRSLAAYKANEIADRIRANAAGAESGAYNSITTIPNQPPDCTSIECTPAQLAVFDAAIWNTSLQDEMPMGIGHVTGNGSLFTIRVFWDDTRTGISGKGCDPDDSNDMTCYEMSLRL